MTFALQLATVFFSSMAVAFSGAVMPGPVFIATALAGGAIMLFMGLSMFASLPKLQLDLSDTGKRYGRVILSAVVLSLANPYWTVWWVTIGLGFMQKSLVYGLIGGAVFYLGHIAGDFLWYTALSFSVSKGRRFLTTPRYRVLIGLCAVLLCFFAISFIISGIAAVRA